MSVIYLDNNATTALAPEVTEAITRVLTDSPGNPSSVHSLGRSARRHLDESRESIAEALGARPRELVFTGSGSEADSLAIIGTVHALGHKGGHLVVGAVEHSAVLEAARYCVRYLGAELTEVAPDADGIVSAEAVEAALREDTLLVSVMAANNETGAIMPVEAIGTLCRERGIRYHCDAVQAVGRMPMAFDALPVDLLTVSAHKLHGPKGVGALLVRRGQKLRPVIQGGGQERGLRPGTENVAYAVGFATALELALAALAEGSMDRVRAQRDRLEAGLLASVDGLVVNGPADGARRVANTLSISCPGAESEGLLISLDRAGVCLSSGSACASGSIEPSHVLRAMGLPPERMSSSIRISLSRLTTDSELNRVLEVFPGLVERLRSA